ncbi:MAG: bifunctional 2-polyprenyl-6-hydroxyphenol methylase/3-demethylubiquinol 3-O-methyltransferase UbiG [Hyphomicrobiaceae bacterium]
MHHNATGRPADAPVQTPPDHRGGGATADNVDAREIARFAALAGEWWAPNGKFRPLHQLTAPRMAFIRREACRLIGREDSGLRPLDGLTALDVGCGGGLASEPLARLGATVTAIDLADESIAAARHHAAGQGLSIDYRTVAADTLIAEGRRFDLVVSLEVIEHVPDPASFVATLARLMMPGGALIVSTINRTLQSYALAIVGAEYVLRWLPVGTHQWARFVTPAELSAHLASAGLQARATDGLVYDLLADRWQLSSDIAVNYILSASA